ncbi:hypothetical protein LWI28_007614 [Acer negundo]|uniref:Uncharacterized protein n=1 Tax=Acer negundo TaxID=4023 RepID=A0AAD5JJ60_ACENE|nr:hypothetical protein LWI28_007614 [Acer negundo]
MPMRKHSKNQRYLGGTGDNCRRQDGASSGGKTELLAVTKGLGTALHLNKVTRDHTYGYYARILFDLDISIDLPKSIMVEVETYRFPMDIHYENFPHIFSNYGNIGHQVLACRKIKSNNSAGGRKRSKVLENVYKPVNSSRLVEDKRKDFENSKQVLEEIRAATNCESLNENHNYVEIKEGKSSSKEICNSTANGSKQHDRASDVIRNTPMLKTDANMVEPVKAINHEAFIELGLPRIHEGRFSVMTGTFNTLV